MTIGSSSSFSFIWCLTVVDFSGNGEFTNFGQLGFGHSLEVFNKVRFF